MASTSTCEGRVAFVTGSTRGIGWAVARALAAQGTSVVLNGCSDPAAVEARAEELAATTGVPVLALAGDVADPAFHPAAFRAVFQRFRRLDVFVANAGVLADGLLGAVDPGTVGRALDVNVRGAIEGLQGAARLMRRGGGGAVVLMSSVVAAQGAVGQSVYAASKSALEGLTRSAARELGPAGIRVNAVAPGIVDTDLFRSLPDAVQRGAAERVPLGRLGTPDDVAAAVVFLAGDGGAYVTGQVLGVDGGLVV